jgi:hypothetical protein
MLERMMKLWNTPIYAFYHPTPTIGYEKERRYHEFRCFKKSCSKTIRRYLDTRDSTSTGNMHRHTKKCWGTDILTLAMATANVRDARESLAKSKDGSIAEAFKVKGKGKATYSHRQHTRTETRYFLPNHHPSLKNLELPAD